MDTRLSHRTTAGGYTIRLRDGLEREFAQRLAAGINIVQIKSDTHITQLALWPHWQGPHCVRHLGYLQETSQTLPSFQTLASRRPP